MLFASPHFIVKMSNKKKVVHSQGREIIYSVYKYMKNEKDQNKLTSLPLNRLQERVSEATGVSTVKRIIKEADKKPEDTKFKSPRKNINKHSPKSSADQYEEEIIRNVIHSFAAIHKKRPTMRAVFEAVKSEEGANFTGKITSFRSLVHKIGFRWKKNSRQQKSVYSDKRDRKSVV